ncbi:MAG TPA: c-type cytochrome [Gammaproteobacteria bacterium]|nr:c-type cytochrome [Gammaproteobacteria bacterium]
MSIRFDFALLVAAGLVLPQLAGAQSPMPLAIEGDAARGETLAYTCGGCHGIEAAVNAYPTYHVPKLGGQNADYLEVALQGYRQGTRAHATMQAQASALTDQDIADLAAYFAGIGGEPARGISSAGAEAIRQGEEQSATCAACHGPEGIALAPQWPNLAGQHGSYLLESMKQYRESERTDPVMAPLVSQLDDEMLAQIAAYYAAIGGLYPTRQ